MAVLFSKLILTGCALTIAVDVPPIPSTLLRVGFIGQCEGHTLIETIVTSAPVSSKAFNLRVSEPLDKVTVVTGRCDMFNLRHTISPVEPKPELPLSGCNICVSPVICWVRLAKGTSCAILLPLGINNGGYKV